MGKLTLVLGGSKSGKSLFAENRARRYTVESNNNLNKVAYLATAEAGDDEMAERVMLHKKRRPKEWQTIETPLELENTILSLDKSVKFLIIDCITLYISNILLHEQSKSSSKPLHNKLEICNHIAKKINTLCDVCNKIEPDVIMVSNEVGLSIVPDNILARTFSDIAGNANQIIAKKADEVYFLVAGIAQKIK